MSTQTADPRQFGFPEPHTNTRQYRRIQGDPDERLHTDAAYLRREHGIARFDPDVYEYENLAPNVFEHVWDGGRDRVSGGSEFLATGPMNSGKTTLAKTGACIEMDINDGKPVWRATSGARTDWADFAPVARVCIPEGYRATARFVSTDKSRYETVPVNLGDIVREVVHYSDIMHLNREVLKPGMFHVVYPDREFRGCQWVYEQSEKKKDGLEFVAGRDPASHWWFGWTLSLVETGPYPWTTWICDEIKDIAPEGAAKDAFATLQKVELLGDAIADFRKNGISAWFFGHREKHLHNVIRDRIRWRIQMNGAPNPTTTPEGAPVPVGYDTVPMKHDLTTDMDIGEALIYNQENFEGISWPKIESFSADWDLKVNIEPATGGRSGPEGVVTA